MELEASFSNEMKKFTIILVKSCKVIRLFYSHRTGDHGVIVVHGESLHSILYP